ncbi:MAG: type II secretion system F family protein [Candidatus Aenigmatarchaeota archaeon]
MSYASLSFKLFGDISKSLRIYFLDIKEDLNRAGLMYTLEEYLSIALLTTTITFISEIVLLSFIFGIIVFDPILALLLGLLLSLTISSFIFFLFYSYPAAIAKTKENNIKKVLPFAVSYLATMSSSKVQPIVLFRTISEFDEYGEVAKEAKNIVRYVDMFGMTTTSAIKKQAKRTPSKELRELLWSMNILITTGGDLTTFLKQKSEELMADYRRRIRKYSQDLSLFVEIYLTLIITGSIFFIVLSSVISALSIGVETILIQSFIVFILLPLLSIGFIILIKSLSPLE